MLGRRIRDWFDFMRCGKKVIYTANFGDKDAIKPAPRIEGYDCVLFTDDVDCAAADYQVVYCKRRFEDPTRDARRVKILAHEVLPDYDYSVWLDASITLSLANLDPRLERYLANHDMALHVHPDRTCIYEEAKACIRLRKDEPAVIAAQMARYAAEGFPANAGLVSCGIIYRRHTPAVEEMNTAWWNEICRHSRRDQLSFNYVAWKQGADFFSIEGHVRRQTVPGFSISPHKRGDFRGGTWATEPAIITPEGSGLQ